MSFDGIRKIKKKVTRIENKFVSPTNWGVDSLSPQKYISEPVKKHKEQWNWKEISHEIRIHVLNKKNILASLSMILILGILSISVSSYNFISKNYDFLKFFKNGRYLLIFQNNSEMRATGGFIGSFATIEVNNGLLKDYYFNTNIYKMDNDFTALHSIEPPDPVLASIVPDKKWAMRDSNWAVDYPTAAQQVAWFYEQEGGQPVDGVVVIDATVMSDILKITGPVDMPEYGVTVNSDNFLTTMEFEKKAYFQDEQNKQINEPKTILKDLVAKVFPMLLKNGNYAKVLDLARVELAEKQILFYFYDGNKQSLAISNGWAGEIKRTTGDYLYINNSNLAGNKSSLNVKEDVRLNSSTSPNGTQLNTLTITRTHTGTMDWPDGPNTNYMRILVPYGSKLVSAKLDDVGILQNIDVKKESGDTVFALWVNTQPRSSRILTIAYELPSDTNQNHSLYIQKQPGNLGDSAEVIIGGETRFTGNLNTDKEIKW